MLVDHLLKINKEFKNLKKLETQAIFTKMNLIKRAFSMIWPMGDFKDLARRTTSGKILRDKVFNITKIPKYDGYQRGLASMIYKFFDKKFSGSGRPLSSASVIASNKENIQLADELH